MSIVEVQAGPNEHVRENHNHVHAFLFTNPKSKTCVGQLVRLLVLDNNEQPLAFHCETSEASTPIKVPPLMFSKYQQV